MKIRNKWIPLSEQMPPDNSVMIVTVYNENKKRNELRYPVWYRQSWYANAKYFYNEDNRKLNERVLAWLPLPDPYEGGGEDA